MSLERILLTLAALNLLVLGLDLAYQLASLTWLWRP